ncbi:MAG TPA: hypothetical protein PLZ73_08950 [bacterium]|nr:hypothetical protein [bacterium]
MTKIKRIHCMAILMGIMAASCSTMQNTRIGYNTLSEVPPSTKLPIDGEWRDLSTNMIIQIESSRAYSPNYKGLFGEVYDDYSKIIFRDVERLAAGHYSCWAAYIGSSGAVAYKPAQLTLVSESELLLSVPTDSQTGSANIVSVYKSIKLNYPDGFKAELKQSKDVLHLDDLSNDVSAIPAYMDDVSTYHLADKQTYTVEDFPIVDYKHDINTGKGTISVDLMGKGILARHWVVKNIGVICSSKYIALEAGEEQTKGGRYHVLSEHFEDGILTVEFQTLY